MHGRQGLWGDGWRGVVCKGGVGTVGCARWARVRETRLAAPGPADTKPRHNASLNARSTTAHCAKEMPCDPAVVDCAGGCSGRPSMYCVYLNQKQAWPESHSSVPLLHEHVYLIDTPSARRQHGVGSTSARNHHAYARCRRTGWPPALDLSILCCRARAGEPARRAAARNARLDEARRRVLAVRPPACLVRRVRACPRITHGRRCLGRGALLANTLEGTARRDAQHRSSARQLGASDVRTARSVVGKDGECGWSLGVVLG